MQNFSKYTSFKFHRKQKNTKKMTTESVTETWNHAFRCFSFG